MKKLFISFISGGIAFLLFSNHSFAQAANFKELPPITVTASSTISGLSAKLSKAFTQSFKDATHLRWYQAEKNYLVMFIMNEQENRALFTPKGYLVYHISYGGEKHLPVDVRKQVKSIYYDQTITRVLKVNQNRRTIWVISMEDDKSYIMARVEDNELEETQRFQKSK